MQSVAVLSAGVAERFKSKYRAGKREDKEDGKLRI